MMWVQSASLKKILKDFSLSVGFSLLVTSLLDKMSLGNYVGAYQQYRLEFLLY